MKVNELISQLANELIRECSVYGGLILIMLFFTLKSFGQTPFSNVEIHPKNEWGRFIGVPIVDEPRNVVNIGLVARKYLHFLQYDNQGILLSERSFDKPNKLFDEVLGYSISENNYNIFFSNIEFNQISMAKIDKQNQKAYYSEIDINLKKKYLLCSFTHDNEFYLITMLKSSSELQLYRYSIEGKLESMSYDFSKYDAFFDGYSSLAKILNTDNFTLNISQNITKDSSPKLEVIDENTPISMEKASGYRKIYRYDNKIIISMDHIKDKSMFIEIDLHSWDYKLKSFLNTSSQLKDKEFYGNSFLAGNNLYQISSSENAFIIDVHDYQESNYLKSFHANNDEEISFKNGAFKKEGSMSLFSGENDTIVKSRKLFFKKMYYSSVGLHAKEINGDIELRIGAFKEREVAVGVGGAVGNIGFTFSLYSSFATISVSRAIYFQSILDGHTLEHKQGPLIDSVHDHIIDHLGSIPIEIEGEVIYVLNGHFYFGYYDYYVNRYIITEF